MERKPDDREIEGGEKCINTCVCVLPNTTVPKTRVKEIICPDDSSYLTWRKTYKALIKIFFNVKDSSTQCVKNITENTVGIKMFLTKQVQ